MPLPTPVAYWKMDETSGNRVDQVGSISLTDTNTVGSTTGKVGDCGTFVRASSEYLTCTDNATLSTGDIAFTWAGWVYLETKPVSGTMYVFEKAQSTASAAEYALLWSWSADRFRFILYNSSASVIGDVSATTFGAPSTGTWYFVAVWHDPVANQVGISVNAGAANTAATTGAPSDTATRFALGSGAWVVPNSTWNGRLDEWAMFKSVVSSADLTLIYNGGVGDTWTNGVGWGQEVATGGIPVKMAQYRQRWN